MATPADIPADILAAARERTLAKAAPPTVEIAAVATAVPEHVVTQDDAKFRAQKVYPQYARLEALYTNTGIDTRYSVEPVPWHLTTHTWEERTELLPAQRARASGEGRDAGGGRSGPRPARHRHDRHQHDHRAGDPEPRGAAHEPPRLPPRRRARCRSSGSAAAAASADLPAPPAWPRRAPASNVLFLTVDLCSLCLRVNDPSLAMFVSAALFGDGAAGVVLRSHAAMRRGKAAGARARLRAMASTSGRRPSTSWAGTSRTTASASC